MPRPPAPLPKAILSLALIGGALAQAPPQVLAGGGTAGFETAKIGGLTVAVWRPAGAGDAPRPLIVFSPGFTACAAQPSFLNAALAEAGYVVVAPEHKDSACAGGGYDAPEAPFDKPAAWSQRTYRQRGRDIGALIDVMKSDPQWSQRIDASRIGLMGHSLGGYTVLGLAGAWPTWQRSDVRAVLALAPLIGPLLRNGKLENIRAPVMYQVGARDGGTTALIKRSGGAYDRTRSVYLVEFKDANHFAWSDSDETLGREIAAFSISFFDAHLKGKPFVRPRAEGVATFKMK